MSFADQKQPIFSHELSKVNPNCKAHKDATEIGRMNCPESSTTQLNMVQLMPAIKLQNNH